MKTYITNINQIKIKIKKHSKLSNNIMKQESATTKKTNPKNIYNTKIKNNISITKVKLNKNSEGGGLNSTAVGNDTTPKDTKARLIDLLKDKDNLQQESYIEFNKTSSAIEKERKYSDITILDEFKKEQFKNISNCNTSSYLNYDLGKSITSDSSLGDESIVEGLNYIKEGFSHEIYEKDNLSCIFEPEFSFDFVELTERSSLTLPSQSHSGIYGFEKTCRKINGISILTNNDLSIFNNMHKLDISNNSCTCADIDEVILCLYSFLMIGLIM
jgi:hypothetical protein